MCGGACFTAPYSGRRPAYVSQQTRAGRDRHTSDSDFSSTFDPNQPRVADVIVPVDAITSPPETAGGKGEGVEGNGCRGGGAVGGEGGGQDWLLLSSTTNEVSVYPPLGGRRDWWLHSQFKAVRGQNYPWIEGAQFLESCFVTCHVHTRVHGMSVSLPM